MSKYKLIRLRPSHGADIEGYLKALSPFMVKKDTEIIVEIDGPETLMVLGKEYHLETEWHCLSNE